MSSLILSNQIPLSQESQLSQLSQLSDKPCIFFWSKNGCVYGDECKYSHDKDISNNFAIVIISKEICQLIALSLLSER